ncbi:MAG: hypothetical protein Aurels2KO_26170 [Aureliella sp.]
MKPYLSLLILFAGCQTQPPETPRLTPTELYRLHCSGCHGDGSGNGHIASTLKVRPRNLKHKEWQSSVSDEHIKNVIRDGGKPPKLSSEMPSFASKLTKTQINELAQYIRRLR